MLMYDRYQTNFVKQSSIIKNKYIEFFFKVKKRFPLFTCKSSRNQDGYDGGASTGVDLGKSSEKEPVSCHCAGQLKHGEHGT